MLCARFARFVSGRRILAVELNLPRILAAPSPATLNENFAAHSITGVSRRGKYILIALDNDRCWWSICA